MNEYEFTLADRLDAIRKADLKYDLNKNGYLSFSGGKDSMTVSKLLDLALPGNRIPRVFCDTGIEYNDMRAFVLELAKSDERIVIKPQKPIKKTLDEVGYPFKSKEHALRVSQFNKGSTAPFLMKYIASNGSQFTCPKILQYQFLVRGKYNYSNRCCTEFKKKKPFAEYNKSSGRHLRIDGMMSAEGGQRSHLQCFTTKGNTITFHPIVHMTEEWCEEFRSKNDVKLCRLYYPPFNFKRTGCKGCPFALDLQEQLTLMDLYLPAERKQCEAIWKPVYDEYRRLGYRLNKDEQLRLF